VSQVSLYVISGSEEKGRVRERREMGEADSAMFIG